jgi:putative phage-type endonuclease
MVEILKPQTEAEWLELRAGDVTSTESPALFGCSPYTTQFELVHRKRERQVVTLEPNERVRWGSRLQDAIAIGIAEDNGWEVRRMSEYMRIPDIRMGSSFDFAVGEEGLLEVKNVDALAFRDGWLVEGDSVEAPPHIELQVQHQLAVSGRKWAAIGALVGGNRVVMIRREPDSSIVTSIRERVAKFWDDIAKGIEPSPNWTEDAGFIARLYSQAASGKVLDVRSDSDIAFLAAEYARLGEEEKTAKSQRDAVKAQLLMKIGDAEKAVGDGFSISAGTVSGGPVSFERASYRNFRVTWKKAGAR